MFSKPKSGKSSQLANSGQFSELFRNQKKKKQNQSESGITTLRLLSFQYLNLTKQTFAKLKGLKKLIILESQQLFIKEKAFVELSKLRYLGKSSNGNNNVFKV